MDVFGLTPSLPSSDAKPTYNPSTHLAPYQFKPGNSFGHGRPKGSKNRLNAADILARRETRIARHYVNRVFKSDTVLMHAMDRLLPRQMTSSASTMLVFIGSGNAPRIEESTLINPQIPIEIQPMSDKAASVKSDIV